jgi:D-glycero-D-manno-heptose 1,7-bisphosphate phosphatase
MRKKTKDKLNNLNIRNNKIYFDNKNNYINCGIYFFKKEILKNIKNKFSLENDILPNLIKKNKVEGQFYNNFFIDIGTPKSLKKGKKFLPQKLTRPAVFLDRDGVINEDLNYVGTIRRFKIRSGVIKALKFLYKKNIYIFIVTNQAGIAKKNLP